MKALPSLPCSKLNLESNDISMATGLHMIDVMFETNPLDGLCDTRVVLKAQPLKIMYHAVSLLLLTDALYWFYVLYCN